ncbi:spore photoproduct lyase family protein [Actinomadura sp. 21ATH]|uniref:spore photoproduct lyase family protein n=1 Tax=Actinomadura sp. 21ATH TaxID=1735444 RepID=UPI0035BF7781
MAERGSPPNINARRLGLYLRRVREIVELSYEQAAARTGCDPDWLARVETGFARPAVAEVERLLERYEVRGANVADLMLDLATRPAGPEWLASLTGVKPLKRDALISEAEACVVHSYGILQIPPLAQAEPYTRLLDAHRLPLHNPEAELEIVRERQRFRAGGRPRFLDLVDLFRGLPTAKASFATKYVNRDLLDWDPQGRTRIRFSLMPEADSKLLDIRTSPVPERIAAINDFVEAGYEVHVNLSPVVVRDGWLEDWAELFDRLGDALSPAAREQLAAEVIFLTHNDRLHEINLGWHPKAEEVLWRPDLQQAKRSQTGGRNVRYRNGHKGRYVAAFTGLMAERLPFCRIRYAF